MDRRDKLSKLWGFRHGRLLDERFPQWYKDQVSHSFWQAIAEDAIGLTRQEKNAEKKPCLWRPLRKTVSMAPTSSQK